MFTPSKKKNPPIDWLLKPHNTNLPVTQNPRNVDGFAADKGKSIASSTHLGSSKDNWMRLNEAGAFANESLFEQQDREALLKKVSDLEYELRHYQHSMGLLLKEKRTCDSTCEELREALTQARDTLKREKMAHAMALAEVEKREESWRKALGKEQCAANEVNDMKENLERKEKELRALEVKLVAREKVKLQKLYDEHNAVLNSKRQEFELEMNQKRKAFEEEEEALKQKENHEREWEMLDEKKAEIANMLNQLKEEKENFEKLKSSNEERLKNENLIAQEYIQKELEALRMKKASFEASMERERYQSSEKAGSERKKMLQDLEQQKQELELDMQSKMEKLEQAFLEKEKVMKEKYGEHDKFDLLVKKLQDHTRGDKMFLKKLEKCENCGGVINDFVLAVLKFLQEMGKTEGITDVTVERKEEVPEASLYTVSKNVKPKRVIKPKRGVKSVMELEVPEAPLNLEPNIKPKRGARRANTVKEGADDAKAMVGESQDPTEGMEPSGITNVTADNNDSTKPDSVGVEKGSVGKRLRSDPSEEESDNHEADSVSIAAGGGRKRRQTVARESKVPAGTRYSLRQRKT